MGKNLHYTIIQFFEKRMNEHGAVASLQRLPVEDEIIYEIARRNHGDTIRVWLADHYRFGEADFLNRPKEIRRGDFILIARPEAGPELASDEHAQIAVGKIGILMGALNRKQMWTYSPPEQRRTSA